MDTLIQMGVDVGQSIDPAALCVCEVQAVSRGKQFKRRDRWHRPVFEPIEETDYTIRHIERIPLGTSYNKVAERVADILEAAPLVTLHREVWIDITGCGRPVYEMMVSHIQSRERTRRVHVHATTFVHGNEYNLQTGSLGKAFMVSRLQSLLQNGLIHAPNTEEAQALIEELRLYQLRLSESGMDTYGVFKTGKHDDLVTALGLACAQDAYANMIRPVDKEIQEWWNNYHGY
jgi:hypothetical protein